MKTAFNMSQLAKLCPAGHDYLFLSMHEAPEGSTFMRILGGNVYLVETQTDLSGVLMRNTMDVIHLTPDGEFVIAFSFNNNTGGPTWLVPAEVWEANDRAQELFSVEAYLNPPEGDVDETNYDPYAGCDTFERDYDDIPF